MATPTEHTAAEVRRLRNAVAVVAALNLAYAIVEVAVAARISSVSLFADSADFVEDAVINGLVVIALLVLAPGASRARACVGRVMAVVITLPALAAVAEAVGKAFHPEPPDVGPLVITSIGALLVNATCALILVRVRHHGGSLGAAAWYAARNDVLINLTIIVMGGLTAVLIGAAPGIAALPDLALGVVIIGLNSRAAWQVWRLAGEEDLAARALAGEDLDD